MGLPPLLGPRRDVDHLDSARNARTALPIELDENGEMV